MSKNPEQLVAEADKLLKKGWFSFLSPDNHDKAHDALFSAGTQYKAMGDFANAARVFERAADLCRKHKNEIDLVVDLEEAARCYVKALNTDLAVRLYEDIIEFYDKKRQNTKAAKACMSVSEIYEGQEEAAVWLERAAKYHEAQGSHTMASDAQKSMADLMMKKNKYEDAFKLYDQLARKALEDRVSRLGARNLFFMALLAQLSTITANAISVGVDALRERFTFYQELDPQFSEHTREHMLISGVIEALEAESLEKMKDAIDSYSKICTVNDTKDAVFTKATKLLEGRGESIL
uniref:Uncharacterized protein TCIL3000_11_16000 n=1 Tax=Trypanosoma congolense (strain IL3000) TaxID=1068625 RepID=G0V367_TRYCI|nr:unnamed protein product [Trypanosoma congolense IL3000]